MLSAGGSTLDEKGSLSDGGELLSSDEMGLMGRSLAAATEIPFVIIFCWSQLSALTVIHEGTISRSARPGGRGRTRSVNIGDSKPVEDG